MGDLLFILFCVYIRSLMYSGGRNPIEYHREKIKRELESERIERERKEFTDEMINKDRALLRKGYGHTRTLDWQRFWWCPKFLSASFLC